MFQKKFQPSSFCKTSRKISNADIKWSIIIRATVLGRTQVEQNNVIYAYAWEPIGEFQTQILLV